jgi:hypothetical protein
MSDERHRATVRMPPKAHDRLCEELPCFSTDTARFQYLVQFYFDFIDNMGYFPQNPPGGANPPARPNNRDLPNEQSSSNSAEQTNG